MIKKTKIIYFLLFFIAFTACENDDSDDNPPADQNDVSLDQVNDGQGIVETTGDANLDWQSNANWEYSTTINSGGVYYSIWEVIMEGPTDDEYIRIRIVEEESSVSNNAPSDGIYTLGGSMDENDIQIYSSEGNYFFSLTSNGEFDLSKNGDVLEITLEATDLESGGIGEPETFIDVNLALKASKN